MFIKLMAIALFVLGIIDIMCINKVIDVINLMTPYTDEFNRYNKSGSRCYFAYLIANILILVVSILSIINEVKNEYMSFANSVIFCNIIFACMSSFVVCIVVCTIFLVKKFKCDKEIYDESRKNNNQPSYISFKKR